MTISRTRSPDFVSRETRGRAALTGVDDGAARLRTHRYRRFDFLQPPQRRRVFDVDVRETSGPEHLLQRFHRRHRAVLVPQTGLEAVAGEEADQRIPLVE